MSDENIRQCFDSVYKENGRSVDSVPLDIFLPGADFTQIAYGEEETSYNDASPLRASTERASGTFTPLVTPRLIIPPSVAGWPRPQPDSKSRMYILAVKVKSQWNIVPSSNLCSEAFSTVRRTPRLCRSIYSVDDSQTPHTVE